jgi:anthranilate synthase/aminodeoxychorismate synthase-like glutamine amidotransferase
MSGILMIDNYDSFTYNLVQYLGELGADVTVRRNDEIDIEGILALAPLGIVISPGPCTPDEAGISLQVVEELGGEVPMLGVCLGHQAVGQVFGGKVVRNHRIVHGKTSEIHHNGKGIFAGLPTPFEAGRYHALVLEQGSLGPDLEVVAWTDQDEIMGVTHRALPIDGVQFHPESILTPDGKSLLGNWLEKLKVAV